MKYDQRQTFIFPASNPAITQKTRCKLSLPSLEILSKAFPSSFLGEANSRNHATPYSSLSLSRYYSIDDRRLEASVCVGGGGRRRQYFTVNTKMLHACLRHGAKSKRPSRHFAGRYGNTNIPATRRPTFTAGGSDDINRPTTQQAIFRGHAHRPAGRTDMY